MEPGNLSPERRLGTPSPAGKRVQAFIVVSAFLGIAQSFWATFLPSVNFSVIAPSFIPAIVAFCIGATLSVGLLAFGRFAFGNETYAFWVAVAFWISSVVAAGYLLALQGILPASPSGSVYLFYLFYLVLLLPCLSFSPPPKSSFGPLTGWLSIAGWSLVLSFLVVGAVVLLAEHLPPISLDPQQNLFSGVLPYLFFGLYLAAIWLHWRKFQRTQEVLVGYFFGFLTILLWTFPGVIHVHSAQNPPYPSIYLYSTAGTALFYFALLLGYRDLYRGLGRSLDQMTLTHRLNTLVTGSLDLQEICRMLSGEIRKLVHYDRMVVSIFQSAERYRTVFDRGLFHSGIGDRVPWIEEGSAARWIVDHREPVICNDLLKDSRFPSTRKRYEKVGVRSYVIFPMMIKKGVLGTLNLASVAPDSYGQKEVDILSPVVEVLSLAVENATLYQEAKKREEMQRLLKEVSQEITSLDVDSLLKKFSERVREIFKVDISNVRLIVNGVRQIVGVSGIDPERLRANATGTGRGASRWMVENRKAVAIPDTTRNSEIPMGETIRSIGIRGYLGVPFFSREGEVLGVVQALTYEPRYFSQEEIDLLQQLANGVAIALENSRLVENLKSANLRLEQSAKDQQTIREFLSDILLLDLDHLFQKVTEQAAALFQAEYGWLRLFDEDGRIRTRVVVGGKDIVRTGVAHGESRLRGRSKRMLETGKPLTVRDMAEDADSPYHGTVKAVGLRGFLGAPLFSKDHKPLGFLFVTTRLPRNFSQREVTLIEQFARGIAIAIENARLFEEAWKKSRELEGAYQAKSDFLNTMSHELRTPLNVIIGAEQLLKDGFYGALTEEQKKGVEPIARNADELLHLINGILDLARLEAGRVPVQVEEFGVKALMDELEALFAPLVREKGLDLRFGAVNGMKFRSDRSKIKEILQNLVGNAVKYTDCGEVNICAAGVSVEDDGNEGVVFSVRDTGIGIGKEELGKIFEPFYMVEGIDRRKYPGSGLGLSIVKRMVELLGGVIGVESALGKGSTFKLTFPHLSLSSGRRLQDGDRMIG